MIGIDISTEYERDRMGRLWLVLKIMGVEFDRIEMPDDFKPPTDDSKAREYPF